LIEMILSIRPRW